MNNIIDKCGDSNIISGDSDSSDSIMMKVILFSIILIDMVTIRIGSQSDHR